MRTHTNERGTMFVIVAVMVIVMTGLAAAFYALSTSYHAASRRSLESETAFQLARTGVNYLLAQYASDPTYFDTLGSGPTLNLGNGSFELESFAANSDGTRWDLIVAGRAGQSEFRLAAAVGVSLTLIPGGLTIGGNGTPGFTAATINGSSVVGSYDSTLASYNPASPSANAEIAIHGAAVLDGGATTIHGSVAATGNITASGGATATQGLTPFDSQPPIEDIDPFVVDMIAQSLASNDNSTLATLFGASWTPIGGAQNYGDLIVSGGSFVVPAGTYRFRRFEVLAGASVIFDTSTGPVNLCYIGMGTGTGTGNDLIVDGNSTVASQSGGTQNLLRTILGEDCDFAVTDDSRFGQNLSDPNSAGYTQIISLGGNTSSDNITASSGSQVYGRLYARAHNLSVSGGATWYGSGVVRTATVTGATFAVDESMLGRTIPKPDDYEIYGLWRAP